MYKRSNVRTKLPAPAEVFVVAVLLISTAAFSPFLGQESSTVNPLQGNVVAQILWSGIFGITCLLIIMRWRQFASVAISDKLLMFLVGIALLSVLWSAAPEITARRGAALLGTTLFGVYLVARYELEQLLRLLAWALGVAAVLSLVFTLTLPSYGIFSVETLGYYEGEGGWRGIYGDKNALGAAMAPGAIAFLLLALDRPKHRWIVWACFGLAVGLLFLSNALTALISLVALLLLFPFYRALRWRYTLSVPLFIVAILVGGIAVAWLSSNVYSVLFALGRDATLTGRTEIWSAVIESIRQRPWLGYGYGSFWLGWAGESEHVWARTTLLFWPQPIGPEHAHNAVLDVWLDLGLLGVLAFGLTFLLALLRAIVFVNSTRTAAGLWPLACLTFLALYGLADARIVTHNSFLWLLFVTSVLLTHVRGIRASPAENSTASPPDRSVSTKDKRRLRT